MPATILALEPTAAIGRHTVNRLSDAIGELVQESTLLQIGLRHRLLNLSKSADYLKPLIEARVKREVQSSAIVMALSRLQRSVQERRKKSGETRFGLSNVFVNSGLSVISFPNNPATRKELNSLYSGVQKRGGHITITQGVHEITAIVEERDLETLDRLVHQKPTQKIPKISSLGLTFSKDYAETPGFFYSIFQLLYLQNVNIVEIASTVNELILYLNESDIQLAFDTLYNAFVLKERRSRK